MKFQMIIILLLFSNIASALTITEVMPNPKGADKSLEPDGEWVELYNGGNEEINLANYMLYDSEDKNELYLQGTIKPKSYLAIYRNTDSDFNLNNKYDKVRLFYKGTLMDEMEYSNAKEGMSKALTSKGWFDQLPTPNEKNFEEDFSSKCDWKINIETESVITAKPEFKIITSKEIGDATNIKLSRIIKDENNQTVKEYQELEFRATKQKTVKNTPRLKSGIYTFSASIDILDCEDMDIANNEITQLFYIKGNITEKCKNFNNTEISCDCNEIVINDSAITSHVVYESNDIKAERYALYFFCVVLILLIISMKVDNNEKTGNHSKSNF